MMKADRPRINSARIIDGEISARGYPRRCAMRSGSGVWIDLPKWVGAAVEREGEEAGREVVRLYYEQGHRAAERRSRGSLISRALHWLRQAA